MSSVRLKGIILQIVIMGSAGLSTSWILPGVSDGRVVAVMVVLIVATRLAGRIYDTWKDEEEESEWPKL